MSDDLAHFERRRGALERQIAAAMPEASAVSLSPFSRAASGFSNLTLFTELTWLDANGGHRTELVLRAQPPGGGLFPNYDLRLQYDVMASLADTAIPVPQLAWFIDDPDVVGAPCFFMHRVHGEVASGFRPGFTGMACSSTPRSSAGVRCGLPPSTSWQRCTSSMSTLSNCHRH